MGYNTDTQAVVRDTKTEADAVAAIVKAAQTPIQITERKGVVILPGGNKINLEDERFESQPRRKRAAVSLVEASSFIGYVNAYKELGFTHIFGLATEEGGSFTALIDYHGQELGDTKTPRYGEHKVELKLSTTPEWRRWLSNNSKPMSQEAFAEFIEDNMTDIIKPDAGILIDVAQSLQGTKNVQFKAGKNLKNGSVQLQYTETIEATGGRRDDVLEVPDFFVLGIIPFVGAFGVELKARLRFRIGNDGKVSFQYNLERPFKVIEEAFKAAREEIETKTELPVLLGSAVIPSIPVIS